MGIGRTVRFNMLLSRLEREALDRLANRCQLTASEVLRQLIREADGSLGAARLSPVRAVRRA
jgi:hypothetical protein